MNIVEISVRFTPPNQIEVEPERARLDWGKRETARWRLSSSDKDAVLENIFFHGQSHKGPFHVMERKSGDPRVWNGEQCREIDGEFKYDVTVKDGKGAEHMLDPLVATGHPPP